MRAMEFSTFDGREVMLTPRVGMTPFHSPSVFGFYLPEFSPDGFLTAAQLTAPEAQLATGPNLIEFLNGMFSLVDYGLTSCDLGFGPPHSRSSGTRCVSTSDKRASAEGKLGFLGMPGASATEVVAEMLPFAGLDSWNVLAPHSGCGSHDLHADYAAERGPDIAIPLGEMLQIAVPAGTQPCTTFGLNPGLQTVKQLYDAGDALMVANVGALVEPVSKVDVMKSGRDLGGGSKGITPFNSTCTRSTPRAQCPRACLAACLMRWQSKQHRGRIPCTALWARFPWCRERNRLA